MYYYHPCTKNSFWQGLGPTGPPDLSLGCECCWEEVWFSHFSMDGVLTHPWQVRRILPPSKASSTKNYGFNVPLEKVDSFIIKFKILASLKDWESCMWPGLQDTAAKRFRAYLFCDDSVVWDDATLKYFDHDHSYWNLFRLRYYTPEEAIFHSYIQNITQPCVSEQFP